MLRDLPRGCKEMRGCKRNAEMQAHFTVCCCASSGNENPSGTSFESHPCYNVKSNTPTSILGTYSLNVVRRTAAVVEEFLRCGWRIELLRGKEVKMGENLCFYAALYFPLNCELAYRKKCSVEKGQIRFHSKVRLYL